MVVFALTLLSDGMPSRLGGMFGAALALKDGVVAPLQVYAPEAALLLAILLTLAGWILSLKPGGFFPAFSLVIIISLACWAGGMRDGFALMAPALLSLLVLLSQLTGETEHKPAALLAATAAVGISLCLLPVFHFSSPTLVKAAQALRTFITDTFFFTETRTVYSIKVDGYLPLETRLGGAAEPDDHPVMMVQTDVPLLLRGSIHNEYTGVSWRNTMPSRRYRYANTRFEKLRAEATDDALPSQEIQESSDLFALHPVSITMHTDSASTLFSMLRMENLTTPMSLVPYFSTSSEIFITRDLAAGDAYTFEAPVFTGEDTRLDAVLALAAQEAEPKDMTAYLELPDAIAEDVYTLTEKLVSTCSTPLEKARAIRTYLLYNMDYSLTPETPPDNQDFVSYFLLRGEEGYCTYFASAMAVMGRIAGLPTRYIEGYLVQPSGGTALVTGKDAHAWAEVWFDGFGWVAFDATPAHGSGGSQSQQPPPQPREPDDQMQNGQELPQDQNEEQPPDQSENQPQDQPENQPQDQPENQPQDQPENQPQDQPEASNEPEPSPQSDAQDNPPDASSQEPPKHKSRWWQFLLLLLLLAALTLRILWTSPSRAVRRLTSQDERLLLWYRALLGLLRATGLGARASESPSAYALRINQSLPEDAGFLDVADSLTLLGYGRYGASPAQVEHARRCYCLLNRTLPLRARIVWFVTRTVKGLGSVQQVP